MAPKKRAPRAALRALVKAARASPQEITEAPPTGYGISALSRSDVADDDIDWMVRCVHEALYDMYKASEDGWCERTKREEVAHPQQQYLVITSAQGRAAFLSYRYTIEAECATLYVYELYVAPNARRCGLGAYLMRCAAQLTTQNRMYAVVLTIFKANIAANRLYVDKLGYRVADWSPSQCNMEADYEILLLEV